MLEKTIWSFISHTGICLSFGPSEVMMAVDCRARSEWRWLMNGDEMAADRLMKTEIDTEMM